MFEKRLKSFKYAFQGLLDLFQTQANARIHLFFTMAAILFGWFFAISPVEWGTSGADYNDRSGRRSLQYLY